MQPESTTLYFTRGSSDKVYHVNLVEGWYVNFAYGRRDSALHHGSKTKYPVDYMTAKLIYDRLINQKGSKGYTPAETGEVFSDTPDKEVTSFLPQLLNEVTEEEGAQQVQHWLHSGIRVWMQTKHDGERRGIEMGPDNHIVAGNRKGLAVPVHKQVQESLVKLGADEQWLGILDTEDMGDYLAVFDWVSDARNERFSTRQAHLTSIADKIIREGIRHLIVDLPTEIHSVLEYKSFVANARLNKEEGVVLRDGNGIYEAGKWPSGGPCLKIKFWASATCRVSSIHPTKRSVGIELWSAGANAYIPVGNCTVPTNYSLPAVETLVEIKYLYAYEGGSLYQPQYKGMRRDLPDDYDAAITQLKYKKG